MDYDDDSDGPVQELPRPCDRCGAGNVEYAKAKGTMPYAVCAEVQMAFGLIAWLCHDCRKTWHKFFKDLPLHREYVLKQVEIEFWRARLGPATPDSQLGHGIDLVGQLEDLELKINEIANHWLIAE